MTEQGNIFYSFKENHYDFLNNSMEETADVVPDSLSNPQNGMKCQKLENDLKRFINVCDLCNKFSDDCKKLSVESEMNDGLIADDMQNNDEGANFKSAGNAAMVTNTTRKTFETEKYVPVVMEPSLKSR